MINASADLFFRTRWFGTTNFRDGYARPRSLRYFADVPIMAEGSSWFVPALWWCRLPRALARFVALGSRVPALARVPHPDLT